MEDTGSNETLTPRALERRVKRWLLGAPFDCYVQVAPGLETLLADELLGLGVAGDPADLTVDHGGIALPLDLDGLMSVNLASRTASRVLLRVGSFPAASAEMLYDKARRLPWEVHLGLADTYTLRMSSRRSKLQAGDEVSRAVVGAIGRHMRELGRHPKPAPQATLEVHARLENDRCTLSLNTSGEHLHRRGMRTRVGDAPARETLAAAVAILGLAGLKEPDLVVDPFCGSGAVLVEAGDVLAGLAPGRARPFAFEAAGWFRPGRWREVRRRFGLPAGLEDTAPERVAGSPGANGIRLLGIDSDRRTLEAARANLAAAGHERADLAVGDSLSFDFDSLGAHRGLILSNLPYGVRLGDAGEANAVTRRFLSHLGEGRTRWRFALLTNDLARVTEHPDIHVERAVQTMSGGLRVHVVTGQVGRA